MQPLVELYEVAAKPPSLSDNTADLDRLTKVLAGVFAGQNPVVPFPRIAPVAESFRRADFKGFAVVAHYPSGPRVIDFVARKADFLLGMALDLGTTHLEASLVDLLSGKVLERAAVVNGQLEFGTDILTRIHFAASRKDGKSGLDLLHERVLASIQKLAAELARRVKVKTSDIMALAVSGNTTMAHFFLRQNPHHLCREPYIR